MKKFKLAALALTAILTTGCATIVSDSEYNVSIQSTPSGAAFTIKNRAGTVVHTGTTPQNVVLKASAGYFKGETYQITFKPVGKNTQEKTVVLDSTLDGWYLGGNLLFGGPIGYLIVDPLTGAMFQLPTNVMADLSANNATSDAGLNIISTDSLTAKQKAQLKPIKTK